MKSNIFTLLTLVAIPLSAAAAPEPAAINGEPAVAPAMGNQPQRISTKFHNSSIKNLGEAATKLKERIQEKPFNAIPDPRTSRMVLMGSERAINQAIEMLDKMEPKTKEGLLVTRFHDTSITDLEEAATKLNERIQDKPFQAIPDARTSRIVLMGSDRAVNQAIEMLDEMGRE